MSTIYRVALGLLAVSTLNICATAGAADDRAGVSEAQFAEFMDNEVLDAKDLAEGAEIQRDFFNRITPPGTYLNQPLFPFVVPFAAENFPDAFLDDLLGVDKNSVSIFPLSLALDPNTRETLVYNVQGKLIATLPANRASDIWPEDSDPARVKLFLNLLPAEDVEPYLYAENRIAESIKPGTPKSAKSGGIAKLSLGANECGISDIQKSTNGFMQVTVTNGLNNGAHAAEVYSYTVIHTSTTETVTLWYPTTPPFNGLESMWECRTTNLVLTNSAAVWEDASIPSNARVRFYGVAIHTNTDNDGLTDGMELFVYHTSPSNTDTDGDGMDDPVEINQGYDPTTANESAAVWIRFPENGRRIP